MTSNGGSDGHPFRVTLDQQPLASALAHELAGDDVTVHAEDSRWIVSINGAKTDQFVVRVLDAIRDTLTRQADASALVELDGQEYVMRGDDHVSTDSRQAPPADEPAERSPNRARRLSPQPAEGS